MRLLSLRHAARQSLSDWRVGSKTCRRPEKSLSLGPYKRDFLTKPFVEFRNFCRGVETPTTPTKKEKVLFLRADISLQRDGDTSSNDDTSQRHSHSWIFLVNWHAFKPAIPTTFPHTWVCPATLLTFFGPNGLVFSDLACLVLMGCTLSSPQRGPDSSFILDPWRFPSQTFSAYHPQAKVEKHKLM